jgi:putative spermidine/putrescine transport system substrate-binding protein
MHIAKGSEDIANAYKYIDTVLSTEVQTQLMKPPYFMAPVNSKVALDDSLPVKNLNEMSKMIQHDWTKINPLRAEWITRFNKEVS